MAKGDSTAADRATATTEEIVGWIEQLNDARYRVREEATFRLMACGTPAAGHLLAAANGEQPESADRALWILRRMARSRDDAVAIAALERLAQLRDRPSLVARAEAELAERGFAACEQHLTPLGAEMSLQPILIGLQGGVIAISVRLGERWHGTGEDLRRVSGLRYYLNFSLQGEAVTDDVVTLFTEREKLGALYLVDTKVTPAAVDALKQKHPKATVFARNRALLGVVAESLAGGVVVTSVEPGTAAANAGIQCGDVIASIDGHAVPDFDRLTIRIAQHKPGDGVALELVRNEQRLKLTAVLGERTEFQ